MTKMYNLSLSIALAAVAAAAVAMAREVLAVPLNWMTDQGVG